MGYDVDCTCESCTEKREWAEHYDESDNGVCQCDDCTEKRRKVREYLGDDYDDYNDDITINVAGETPWLQDPSSKNVSAAAPSSAPHMKQR